MCNPLIGIALSVGGSLMQAQQQQAFVTAQNQANKDAFSMSQAARERERMRQQEFEAEQILTFDNTADDMTRDSFDQGVTDNSAEFMEQLDARPAVLNETAALPGQDTTSGAIIMDRNRQAAKAAADARQRIKALSDLTAYGNTGQERAVTFSDATNDMAVVSGLRRGSLGVANQEQQIPAATVHPPNTTFADILSGVGGMLSMNAGAGGGLFGTTGAALAPATSIRPMMNPLYG